MLAVVVTATLAITWWLPAYRLSSARASWQPPPDAMLASSMREQPAPGWRTNVAELGMPRNVGSQLAVSSDERNLQPFIGNIGANAYFLASTEEADGSQWWLVGIDVHSGRPLFGAVPLGSGKQVPDCFLNGPTQILCLDGVPSKVAWVIDGRSGEVGYSGPTDLQRNFGTLTVRQVGIYAVATNQNEGAFGIGSQAETTWFVPGDGRLQIEPPTRPSASSQTLTAQDDVDPMSWSATVFSVADGRVIEPDLDDGSTLIDTVFYTGGFAAEVDSPDAKRSSIMFFDDSGKRVGEHGEEGVLERDEDPIDLPVVWSEDRSIVYSAQGQKLIEVPGSASQLVGTTLMANLANSREFPEWQQYNLRDGTAGPVCDYPMHNYLGTDGSTLVFEVTNRNAELLAKAHDLNSCERLWTLPKQPDSLDRIWNIDGTLVQLANEGTELLSLVAPG
ncbi:MAG: hypothetical protein WBC15_04510 [Mycobacterium sp.]